jgi:hypothetical protein
VTTELLGTIFAGLTCAVIAATAIAAVVQLRHLRSSASVFENAGYAPARALPW